MIRVLIAALCMVSMAGAAFAESQAEGSSKKVVRAEIYAQLGHSNRISTIAISPDGRTIISGSQDNTIKLWDVASGRELKTLSGHSDVVSVVAYSPDGQTIISSSWDKTIKLWDAASGHELRSLKGHNYGITAMAVSSDGRTIVSGSCDIFNKSVNVIKLWDATSGRELSTFKRSNECVNALSFSPDGRTIVSGNLDNTLKLWDAASGRKLSTLKGHGNSIHAVAFSPDGRSIISGSGNGQAFDNDDTTIKLWDVTSGRELRTLKGHTSIVYAVAFSPDGNTIVSGSMDKTLKLWDVTSGRLLHTLSGHGGTVATVAFSPDGHTIVSGSDDITLKLWDATNGRELKTLGKENSGIAAVAFSPDGNTIVAGSADSTIKLWGAASGRELRTLKGHSNIVRAVAFSPDGRSVVSGSWDKTIKLWDATNGRELHTLSGHSEAVDAVAFSPDGRTIVSNSNDDILKLWNAVSGRELRTLRGNDDINIHTDFRAVAFSHDGRTIVGTQDDYIKLWDATSGSELKLFGGSQITTSSVAFSPDDQTVGSGIWDKTIKLWNTSSGRELKTLVGHSGIVMSLAFSPDGRTLLSGSMDKTLKLWDVTSGQVLRTFSGHEANVYTVAFSPDGRELISGSDDGTVRKWDVSTGKEIAQFISFDDGEWVTITPEGYYDSSEKGDKHLNVRIRNNVFGIDQYRESFYRPDLVKIALGGGSIKDFRNIASVKQSPQLQIVDTQASTADSEAKVTLKLTDMGGGIGDVRLYLNGSAVVLDNSRALKLVDNDVSKSVIRTYTIKLINGKNSIRAIAFNADNSMQSSDVLYEITASFKSLTKPTIYALIVGISEFKNPKLQLKYPVADAELFADTLAKTAAGLFEKVNIKKLTTIEETSSENIKKELMALRSLNPDDLFVFYVASHGTVDDGEYFLITSNVGSTSTTRLKADALPQADLKELIANIPTTKKVIVLDTCNAGAMGDALQVAMLTRGMSEDTAIKILSRAVGSTILSASSSTQEALEGYKEHGLFTYVLTEGLSGKADKGKSGFIKTTDLADYVDSEVPALAETVFKRAQYPNISISGQPFHLGKVVAP